LFYDRRNPGLVQYNETMGKAVTLAGLVFVCALAIRALVACSPFGGASQFSCTADSECQGAQDGRCEPNGACSFADEACGIGGRRYGELSGSLAGTCVGDEPPMEAGVDTGVDVTLPEAGDSCYGDPAGLVRPCFGPADIPSGTVTLNGAIDTDGAMCSATVKNTTACVIAGDSIVVNNGSTVQITGGRPLVLLAVTTIQINGTVDAASHRGTITPGAAGNFGGCDAGTAATNAAGAGGGGAGGSFGAAGGDGGGPGATKGVAGAAQPGNTLRGGCKGGDGKEGGGAAATRGIGGNGGGVVYLIADGSITVGATGTINASGAGGTNGVISLAGGGGGGSGGLIGFDSPTVTNGGAIFANGGSGAEGSGINGPGATGNDPTGIGAATPNAPISGNGGDGANGGAAPTNTGGVGATSTDGGGGGGGVGVIRKFRAATIGGMISPAAN